MKRGRDRSVRFRARATLQGPMPRSNGYNRNTHFKIKVAWWSVIAWLYFCTMAAITREPVSKVAAQVLGTESRRESTTKRAGKYESAPTKLSPRCLGSTAPETQLSPSISRCLVITRLRRPYSSKRSEPCGNTRLTVQAALDVQSDTDADA